MTKKLEELFELPDDPDSDELDTTTNNSVSSPKETVAEYKNQLTTINDNIDKIDSALPEVAGLDDADSELDDLAELAKQSFNDLSDLGMQVESRFASEIFAVAGQMLGHAINAKNVKLTKKLKMIELQIKKANLDKNTNGGKNPDDTPGEGRVLDRNELLKYLSENKNSKTE